MSVAMKKLDGVESVDVSLEKASVDIRLKPDNRITLPQIRKIIRSTGYTAKDAQVNARGRVADRSGKPVFDLLNGDAIDLAEPPKDTPAGVVDITGVSRADKGNAEQLTIKTIGG